MGHVSDFNGMNTCDEAGLNEATTDLISADNLLDLPLNENFLPIYHSFPDDIYRQPHLYAANNLTSFMNNDNDRDEYFDEPLELDLLLDSNFNIDFGSTATVLGNGSDVVQNHAVENKIESNKEKSESVVHIENVPEYSSNEVTAHESKSQTNYVNTFSSTSDEDKTYSTTPVFNDSELTEVKSEQIPKIVIKLKSESQILDKKISCVEDSSIANSVMSDSNYESFNLKTVKTKVKDKHKHKKHKKKSRHKKKHDIDKIKNKTLEANKNFNDNMKNCTTESYSNENLFLNDNAAVNIHMNDSEMHVYNQHSDDDSNKNSPFIDENFETCENNYVLDHIKTEPLDDEIIEQDEGSNESLSYVNKNFELHENNMQTKLLDEKLDEQNDDSNENLSYADNSFEAQENNFVLCDIKSEPEDETYEQNDDSNENLSYVDENSETHENNYAFHDIKTEPLSEETNESVFEPVEKLDSLNNKTETSCDEISQNRLNEPLATDDAVDFQFQFENTDEFSQSSSISKKEKDTSVDDFFYQEDVSSNENIPYKSELEIADTDSSAEYSEHNGYEKQELPNEIENKSMALNNETNKSNSASDLIEELNAHHQQVFEEIEVSTSELELEIHNTKNSDIRPKTSHQTHTSANDHIISQNNIASKHGENDMNSQNHIPVNKPLSPNHHVSSFQLASNHHGSTARIRNISSSNSSINSKSSTSHRSYRKRRRSSSSSSSSDQEKFYNRPVKFDPVTQTYCDEFGREIRQSELKYYLDTKSNFRDSHYNNSSSSNSRSKSPRYKSRHRKYHKSRSGSRSHRRRRHSSSRSRSRSRSRRHKDKFDRKYRSPSPKHRSKRHYLDVEENMRAYEERRVMYVGDIPPDYTVEQLKERFSRFGSIQAASIKSKFTADGSLYIFGFVTFKNRSDVCEAIERGNENPSWPRFDLNFGGRRRFCNGNYTDLDGKVAEAESGWYQTSYRQQPRQEDDFAELLRQEQRRLGMSKK